MTDVQEVQRLREDCEKGMYPDPMEVEYVCAEWLRMKEELERIADMNTDSADWYRRRARIGLGLEDEGDDRQTP